MSSSSISSGSLPGRGDPLDHLRHRHDLLAVGGAAPVELDVVGDEARHHRRVHRVGHAALAEQIRPAVRAEAFAPDRSDALDVALRARPDLVARECALEVHRQRRAKAGEARMHLAADRAAMRARRRVGGQQPGLRLDLVQVLGDRQRVPHLDALVGQARHQDRRRQQQDFLARIGVVGRNHHLLELEAGEPRQQPAAQRPRRVVLAADRKRGLGHAAALPGMLDRRASARVAARDHSVAAGVL